MTRLFAYGKPIVGNLSEYYEGMRIGVLQATFNIDSTHIVTASEDGTARIWDTASGQELAILRGHSDGGDCAIFSPKGNQIVTVLGARVQVWAAASGQEIAILRGHDEEVAYAAFSPDGTQIVTASSDRTARVWEAINGQELTVLRGHEGNVNHAAFSPDNTKIVTASSDGTARVWRTVSFNTGID